MSTHNICFRGEIRKILCGYSLLSVAMAGQVDFDHLLVCGQALNQLIPQPPLPKGENTSSQPLLTWRVIVK